MGAGNKSYSASDSTGATIAIGADSNRQEIILRNYGPNTVWMAFNESATELEGLYLKIDDAFTLDGFKAKSDIYFVCEYNETADVKAQILW